MNTKFITLLVDMARILSGDNAKEIIQSLCIQSGVIRASQSQHVPRMMMIEYNPAVISASQICDYIKSKGMDARLVAI